jgi:hypothetical protein
MIKLFLFSNFQPNFVIYFILFLKILNGLEA